MAGYTRQDSTNQIANGKVIDADVFDSEYNAIEGAFNATAGHSHDGSAGEGAPITVVGPAQDVTVSSTQVLPKTTGTISLGTYAAQFQNGYFSDLLYTDYLSVQQSMGVLGAATLQSTLDVTSDTTVGGTFDVTGNTTLGGTLGVTGATTVGGTLAVTGDVTLGAGLTVGGVPVSEYISDTVGAMVSTNTEAGIVVTYQDADNTLDFDVGDFTIALTGDVSGSATVTNLGSATITTTVADNSHNHTSSNITDFTTAARNSISAGEGLDYNATTGVLDAELATATNPGVAAFASGDFSITGAVVSLSKSPTITLGGDVSGTGTMSNLNGTTISVTVADDSHNHVIANVDGLQTELDNIYSAIGGVNPTSGVTVTDNLVTSEVLNNLTLVNGVITDYSTRNLTLLDLGYTGATNADNYGGWNLYRNGVIIDSIQSGERLGFNPGSGIDITYDGSDLTISHSNTSSQSSVSYSGSRFIQGIGVDTYGHITSIASKALTPSDLGINGLTGSGDGYVISAWGRVSSNTLVADSNVSSWNESTNLITFTDGANNSNYAVVCNGPSYGNCWATDWTTTTFKINQVSSGGNYIDPNTFEFIVTGDFA